MVKCFLEDLLFSLLFIEQQRQNMTKNELKRLIQEVMNEMPVGVYQTVGDFEKGGSFRDKRDRALITHPVAIKKVHDFFKNTSADFDFYFVNLSGRGQFQEKGKVDERFIFAPYPGGLGIKPDQLKDGRINDDRITIFFVGNTAAEKVPMTSWTIAHRFGHVIKKEYAFGVYTEWLESQFNEILKLYNVGVKNSGMDRTKSQLFNQIGTMKSARDGKIDRPFEFYYELFAQYLKDGKVTFNRLRSTIIRGYGSYGRKEYMRTANLEEVNEILSDIESDFHFYAEDVLSSCIGNIYVM